MYTKYTCIHASAFVLWDVVCLDMSSVSFPQFTSRPSVAVDLWTCTLDCRPQAQRRDCAKIRVVVLPSNAGRRPSGAIAPRLGFMLYYRVRVGEGVKNSAAGKGVLGPRSLEY